MANAVPVGPYHRSLLALDFDAVSRHVVEAASRLRLGERTLPLALHLFDAPAAGMMKRSMQPAEAIEHYVHGEQRRAATEFHAYFAELRFEAERVIFEPSQGSTAEGILRCAAREAADLIVVGTNQQSGLKRLLLGSVAEGVLRESDRDVLVIPEPKRHKEQSAT